LFIIAFSTPVYKNFMQKKVSIKDIARKLGISISTVSFVVNGKAREKRISEDVISRVTKLVEELGYKPDALARSFRTGKTYIIGFLVDDISRPFFSSLARFIDEEAEKNGYKIIYSSTGNSKTKAKELLQIFYDRHVDGYIIALPEGLENEVEELLHSKKPVVLFDRYFPGLDTDYVIIDNVSGTAEASRHLLSRGFRHIGFVTINTIEQQMLDRQKGYEHALRDAGAPVSILKIDYGLNQPSVQQIATYLKKNPGLDAVIFSANYLCMDGLRAIRQLGLKIPDEISVLSFDDFELLELYSPSVTAIAQPLEAIAANIMAVLLGRLESKMAEASPRQIILPTSLKIRESTRRK